MKENFPHTEIMVRYANGSHAKVCLANMEYNASCAKVAIRESHAAEGTDRAARKPATTEMQ
jgi:hypothetical protein